MRYWRAAQALKSADSPVIVYTMAKVGSMSIYKSILNSTNQLAFHEHSLDQKRIEDANQLCFDKNLVPDGRSLGGLLYKSLSEKNQVKIISCVRDPISRNISAFFDAFELINGLHPDNYQGSIEQLALNFYRKLDHQYPLHWFDNEFYRMLNIHVYQTPFDQRKKYSFYRNDNIEVLLFRTDLEDQIKQQLIRDFLNDTNFKLDSYNVSTYKSYANLYEKFKNNFKLTEDYLQLMRDSKYVNHFFNIEELIHTNSLYKF